MPKRTNPADVANLFIRCFLSDVGEALGGCSNLQWRKTLEYFDFCCAYTGKPVTKATAVMDHAIPMNKRHCGLHLFGNLVPCISAANTEKHYRHYREFLSSPEKNSKGRRMAAPYTVLPARRGYRESPRGVL